MRVEILRLIGAMVIGFGLSACGGGQDLDGAKSQHQSQALPDSGVLDQSKTDRASGDLPSWDKMKEAARINQQDFELAEREAFSTDAVAKTSTGIVSKSASLKAALYRFYNSSTGAHFYTISTSERDRILGTMPQFKYEAVAFGVAYASSNGMSPVYRFYNRISGTHFYTISENEKNYVLTNIPQYSLDGPAFFASQVAQDGMQPVYRFYHKLGGFHFYTINMAERDYIRNNLASTYSYDGGAYYAYPSALPSPAGALNLIAGGYGGTGSVDGDRLIARFSNVKGIAKDASGNLFVVDGGNFTIRKVTPAGVVTTLAGKAGERGTANGTGANARFYDPKDIAVDASGSLYVSDDDTIRKISAGGEVTLIAGSHASSGALDGQGAAARFNDPRGLAVDSTGNLYVADYYNHRIRRVSASGFVVTVAGSTVYSGTPVDGPGAQARFAYPSALALEPSGNLQIGESRGRLRRMTPAGDVTTVQTLALSSASGNSEPLGIVPNGMGGAYMTFGGGLVLNIGSDGSVASVAGSYPGDLDGESTQARFNTPHGLALDSGGLYVTDRNNFMVRRIDLSGNVSVYAGRRRQVGTVDGYGALSRFNRPSFMAADASGNLYISDTDNHAIRRISPDGNVVTFAGLPGISGSVNGQGTLARFNSPQGIAVAADGAIYVADNGNHTIRKISAGGLVTTIAGLAGNPGEVNGSLVASRFRNLSGIALQNTAAGTVLYVTDTGNDIVRKLDLASSWVTTFAGGANCYYGESPDGTGTSACFDSPYGITIDRLGALLVTESTEHTIRRIASNQVVTTVAGVKDAAGSVNGRGTAARFNAPAGIASYGNGYLFVADSTNHTVRRISPDGDVVTVLGVSSVSGVKVGTVPAGLQLPRGVAVFGDRLFVSSEDGVLSVDLK